MMGDQNRTQLNDDQNDKPTLTETEESKLFFWRVWVFVITFLCYCSLHSMRKAFTNQKANLQDFYGFDKVFLGTLDVIFMFAYAIGLLISGYLADVFNVRYVLFCGLTGAAVMQAVFGISHTVLGIDNHYYYYVLWAMNGLLQSTGWPSAVKIMGNWFEEESSGRVFGVWSANASVGNLVGAGICALISSYFGDEDGIPYSFVVPAIFVVFVGLSILFIIPCEPKDVGLPNIVGGGENEDRDSFEQPPPYSPNQNPESTRIGYIQAWFIPGVMPYALCYAFLKGVNYAMFFWLPYFLKESDGLSYSNADLLSMLYDVGQIIGGFFCGYIGDKLGKSSPPVWIMLIISVIPIFCLRIKTGSIPIIAVIITAGGFFVGGPANIISSAISADLGKHESLQGNAQAMSTVAGIIDGTASLGAAITQGIVSIIPWETTFLVLALMLFCSALIITKIFIKEVKDVFRERAISYSVLE